MSFPDYFSRTIDLNCCPMSPKIHLALVWCFSGCTKLMLVTLRSKGFKKSSLLSTLTKRLYKGLGPAGKTYCRATTLALASKDSMLFCTASLKLSSVSLLKNALFHTSVFSTYPVLTERPPLVMVEVTLYPRILIGLDMMMNMNTILMRTREGGVAV